jgi:hypothetical protein
MNQRFNMLRSKVDILTQSNHDGHNNLELNYIHHSDKMADTSIEYRLLMEQKSHHDSLSKQLSSELA